MHERTQLRFVLILTTTCPKLTSIGNLTRNSQPSKETESVGILRRRWKHGVCVFILVHYFLVPRDFEIRSISQKCVFKIDLNFGLIRNLFHI